MVKSNIKMPACNYNTAVFRMVYTQNEQMLKLAKFPHVVYREGAESKRRRGADVMGVVHEGKLSGFSKTGR